MHRSRAPWCAGLIIAALPLAGCEALTQVRAFFQSEDPDIDPPRARLRVDVIPTHGITILLDGVRVATTSPYQARDLRAGSHRLEVRAMGYYPFVLPLTLKNHKQVTVPVALRPRPALDERMDDADLEPTPLPERPPPPPPAPPLPTGVEPVDLLVAPQPAVPVLLDHVPVKQRKMRLERVTGDIEVGVMRLRYSVLGAGLLSLQIAEDGATWSKDDGQVKPGSSFQLHHGSLRLRRQAEDGTDQTVLIRR